MNNLITTLVVEALDTDMTNQAGATATSIANAASTNRLAIQRDGSFTAGNLTNTGANQLIKLSAATTMSDGTVSVMSSSEFKLKDIISSHYAIPSAGTAATYTLAFGSAVKLGGQFFIRLERKDGKGINAAATFSGETLAKLKDEFDLRAAFNDFGNVAMTATDANTMSIVVSAIDSDSDVNISANDGVTFTDVDPVNKKGSLTVAKGLEKSGFITQGAYNQYGFPIVVPESSTAAGQDYGIYTIELRKKVGGRFVFETIKVLIADDEANGQKTAQAINNLLALTAADSTVPTLTSATFSLTDGTTAASANYSPGSADEMFIKLVGAAAAGDIVTVTVTSAVTADAGHNKSQTFTLATATDNLALTVVDCADFSASTVLTATTVITDASGNVSATKTNTITTHSS